MIGKSGFPHLKEGIRDAAMYLAAIMLLGSANWGAKSRLPPNGSGAA
jgi:hypothetical protein